jgi:hypothetical protein
MKKTIVTFFLGIFCLAFYSNVNAQSYKKGDKNFSAGLNYGFGRGIGGSAGLDVGIHDQISVGVIGVYSTRSWGYSSLYNWRVNYIGVAGRGAFHFGKYLKEIGIDEDKLDPYLGIVGGFSIVKYDSQYSDFYTGAGAGLLFGGYAGVRYYLKDNLGVYVEAGAPYSSAGVTLKF